MFANLIDFFKILLLNIKLRSELYLTNQTPVIIYQMGKVRSTSIFKSLKKAGILPVFHTHFLLKGLEERDFFDDRSFQLPKVRFARIRQVRNGHFLYENIIAKRKPVKIISPTREPIGFCISAFFQNFERETGKKYEDSNFTSQELTEIFLKFYPHSRPLNWFDNHIKAHLGIDVYNILFPRNRGLVHSQR